MYIKSYFTFKKLWLKIIPQTFYFLSIILEDTSDKQQWDVEVMRGGGRNSDAEVVVGTARACVGRTHAG